MNNIKELKEKNSIIYKKLLECNCRISVNDKILYEGLLKDYVKEENSKHDPSIIVYEFDINGKKIILTEEHNESLIQFAKYCEDLNDINDIFDNPSLYNNMMFLANDLPLYSFENINDDDKEKIRRYGMNYKKLYENYMLLNMEKESTEITEDLDYDSLIQKLQEAKENNIPIDEGILGAIGGAILGTAFGPKLGNAICNALGVDPKGTFGSLITSRLVMAAIGAKMGWKI